MITALDGWLFLLALVIAAVGFSRRAGLWAAGKGEIPGRPDPWGTLREIFGHRKILEDRRRGILHALVLGGTLVPLGAALFAQSGLILPWPLSAFLSLLLDLLGLGMLLGVTLFLLERLGPGRGQGPPRTLLPLGILLLIGITGFLAEGTRLAVLPSPPFWEHPAGSLLAFLMPPSPLIMQILIRIHFFLVLLLMALAPYTFLRHAAAATLSIAWRRRAPQGTMGPARGEAYLGAGRVTDLSWLQLLQVDACVSCGRCERNCPATLSGKALSPRSLVQGICRQMEKGHDAGPLEAVISAAEVWACTTCMACLEVCPVHAEPLDKILDLRRYRVSGLAQPPEEARPMLRNLEIFGDVYGKGPARRNAWALHREARGTPASPEVLLWAGCSGAFHPRAQETLKRLLDILTAAGIPFARLGEEEACCGDPARCLGDETLFQALARKNIAALGRRTFGEILTPCPHCYTVLRNAYPALGGHFPVTHSAPFLARLLAEGRITLTYPLRETLTLHDPCYLGRGNGLYEPLREICRKVPGATFGELPRNRAGALCCGGGGGRMWLHETEGRRIHHLRAEEIRDAGCGCVATACPYCVTMIEDGLASLDLQRPPKVRDLVEIVADAMGLCRP